MTLAHRAILTPDLPPTSRSTGIKGHGVRPRQRKEFQLKASTWLGGANFEFGDVPDPAIGPDDVLIRIGTVGVCGTDVHITQGLFPSTPPRILGHEASGEIVDVGANVSRDRVGQSVVLNHSTSCGECENCRTWTVSRCERNTQEHAFFAELAGVPDQSAVPIPDGLDVEIASITEPASCCLSGVSRLRRPVPSISAASCSSGASERAPSPTMAPSLA